MTYQRHSATDTTLVIVPARNEAKTIGTLVADLDTALRPASVLVVDDLSTDGTADLARFAGAEVASTPVRQCGLGAAVRLGIRKGLERGYDKFAIFDSDGQYRVNDLVRLLGHLSTSGANLAVGNRLAQGLPDGMRPTRFGLNRAFSTTFAALTPVPWGVDAQCGLRVFDRHVALLDLTNDFTYTQEQLLRCSLAGATIVTTPVDFGPRLHGTSRLVTSTADYARRTIPHLITVSRGSRTVNEFNRPSAPSARLGQLGFANLAVR